jgi:hypothetical protein
VQYVSEAQFDAHGFAEASEAPEPEASAGTGHGVVAGLVHVQGLTASIVYRYRFVAGNAVQRGVQGEDGTFTTQPSGTEFSLPDGRAWELVSPPDKHGGSIDPLTTYGGAIQAAENGGAFTYVTTDPIDGEPPGNRGGLEPSQELATRGTDGWSNEDITSPNSCTGPLQTSVEADSWQEPSNVLSYGPSVAMPALDGCNKLPFSSSISVAPDGQAASTPTGLTVGIHVPQESTLEGGGGLAESAVKETVVALQKACTEKVFAENPSNCPKASRVGEAKVETPVLEGPLTGPAYFVSHGGAKYPELIIVLTGEDGVTVQVHGETFISKAGITTATFSTVPDVPFSNFELELPQREYPALTANGDLCKGTLIMPTEMVGQNGLKINQETKISVTGCPKIKKSTHKKRGKAKKKRKKA